MDFKVEILRYPKADDWMWAKTCALNTVSKTAVNMPTEEWKEKLIKSEHSPIQELWFGIRMQIPYYVSVHFVRHKIGVNHYVSTQRDDRTNDIIPRANKPQGAMVSHIMSINATELVNVAHVRLCFQAEKDTREVIKEIRRQVIEICPEFKDVLVPKCYYRGGLCTEFNPCGYNKTYKDGEANE